MKQTLTDEKFGNCLQTCVAYLLKKDLHHVPNFMLFEHHWWSSLVMYLGIHKYIPDFVNDEAPPADNNEYIVSLKFKRHSKGVSHAVVMKNGSVIFDPYPIINYSYDEAVIGGYYKIEKCN
ncbi:hypothetical protein C7S20_19375 [Christiangramia fulva]|uniref:Peptidase C39-like domain-containing protein n=1 Tax=Christiangramia fulva TaxID=2126553 RepID=A0A2R3ZAB8_9FLAO|nr:hypothetical protein [Christiangramia fulva]AVR47238.1 hypothetical protein C7S20_19375 [Christiangramia fulva]